MEIGLSLGSNLGDRLAMLAEARRQILAIHGLALTAQAPVYETEPVGVASAFGDLLYLNTVLIVESALELPVLSREWHAIEDRMGRRRTADRNSPRPIDIDIIYADGLRIASEVLMIPHPRWKERRFVVQPLADVRPGLSLPGEKRTVLEVLRSLPERERVALFTKQW
jgi:2-amino-4-hydroxy-6-hydroxymethyldihydropteridine diphosphokinase